MNTLILLTKYPLPWEVKSRLAVSIWDKKAARFQEWALQRLIKEHKNRTYRLVIGLRQEKHKDRFSKDFWISLDDIFIQHGEKLGHIIDHALSHGLSLWTSCIIIWSDTADIASEEIQKSFTTIAQWKTVLWPTNDGWYWMVWSSTALPEIFLNMEYSHPLVFNQTTDRLAAHGYTLSLVDKHVDVDTLDDLHQAAQSHPDIYKEIVEELKLEKVLGI